METRISLASMVDLLHLVEQYNEWFFSIYTASLVSDLEDPHGIVKDLEYYIKCNMIEHVGEDIYAFKIYSMIPWNAREILAHKLRPYEVNYLIFEFMLNEYGIISQIPTVLTVATTGSSGLYESDSYSIEFTHVDHSFNDIINNCIFNEDRCILEALPSFALADLTRKNRNMHLIQEEEIAEAIELYENK